MDTKQLGSINLNSSQLKISKSATLVEASASKPQNSFEARLDKQIKQLRGSSVDEDKTALAKNDKNQRDSASKLDSNIREKNLSRAQQERESDEKETRTVKKSVLDKSESTQKTNLDDESLDSGESLKAEEEVNSGLPLAGTILPLSEKNFQGLKSTSDAEEKLMEVALPTQFKLAAEQINGLSQGRAQAAISGSIPGLDQDSGTTAIQSPLQVSATGMTAAAARLAEQIVTGASVQTALNQTDKVNTQFNQSAQASATLNEMPVADIIAQATRLLQVPVATALSKNLAEGDGSENSFQQAVLQVPATGVTGALSGTTTSVGNLSANNLASTIGVYPGSPDWSNQMTQKVSMMLQGGIQKAEIKLNPAHLGPMEIKLSMSDDRASISFIAQHAPVRDAIEQAMPRLREMLEEQGLGLGDVDVSAHSEQQSSEQQSDEISDAQQLQDSDTAQLSENMQTESQVDINLVVDRAINIYA